MSWAFETHAENNKPTLEALSKTHRANSSKQFRGPFDDSFDLKCWNFGLQISLEHHSVNVDYQMKSQGSNWNDSYGFSRQSFKR